MKEEEKEYETIERYLLNGMTQEEREAFEALMKTNSELKERVTLHKAIHAMDDEDDWMEFSGDSEILKKEADLFRSQETLQFSEQLKTFRDRQNQQQTKKRSPWFNKSFFGAVAAVLIIAIFVFYPKEPNLSGLYNEYNNWEELPSLITKGDTANSLKTIEYLFQAKDYKGVIDASGTLLPSTYKYNPQLLLYVGVSHLELDNYEAAIAEFQKLSQSNFIDNHKGYWYTALAYLKQGNKEKSRGTLEIIAKNPSYYKYEDAKKLLKKLR